MPVHPSGNLERTTKNDFWTHRQGYVCLRPAGRCGLTEEYRWIEALLAKLLALASRRQLFRLRPEATRLVEPSTRPRAPLEKRRRRPRQDWNSRDFSRC